MESNARYGLVGSLVVIFTVLIVAAILWLAEVGVSRDTAYYSVYFREQSLDGLQTDSDVTMKGIKVGTVTDLHIPRTDIERVKVTLKLDADTPIKTNTRAVLKRNLLTGLAFIDLTGSSQETPLLLSIPPGENFPVIPEGSTNLDAIAKSLPGLLTDIDRMVKNLEGTFSDENRVSITNTLANVEKLTGTLANDSVNFSELARELRDASAEVKKLAKNANTEVAGLGTDAKESLDAMRTAAQSMKSDTATIAQSMAVMTTDFSRFVRDFNRTAEVFSTTMDKYTNPRAIILGPDEHAYGPGERPHDKSSR